MLSIQPVSIKLNMAFGQKVKKQPKPEFNEPYYSHEYLEKEKDFSFMKGVLCAAIIMSGVHQCSEGDRRMMLDSFKCEMELSKPYLKQIKVEDINNDDVPEIIIESKDGTQSIFDFENKHQYYKDDLECVEIY